VEDFMYVLAALDDRRHHRRRVVVSPEAYARQAARTRTAFERRPSADGGSPHWVWGYTITIMSHLARDPTGVTVHELGLAFWMSMRRQARGPVLFPELHAANSLLLARALRARVDAGAPLDDDTAPPMWRPVTLPVTKEDP
jgi:hypothetical protein